MSSPSGSEISSLMKLADGVCLVRTILVHLLSQVQFLSGEVLDVDDSWIVTLFVRSLRCSLSDDAYFLRFNTLVNIPRLCNLTLYVSVSQIGHWQEVCVLLSDNGDRKLHYFGLANHMLCHGMSFWRDALNTTSIEIKCTKSYYAIFLKFCLKLTGTLHIYHQISIQMYLSIFQIILILS